MSDTTLTPAQSQFILHWGEMGVRWGINRTMAQIHALLYLSPAPLDAEEIARLLSVARSNVSTSLRELQGWGIVRVAPQLGSRRDRFESLGDVWEMFEIIVAERKRREVDPTIQMLRQCLAAAEGEDPQTRERIAQMAEFFDTMSGFYDDLKRLPNGSLSGLVKIRRKVKKLLVMGGAG